MKSFKIILFVCVILVATFSVALKSKALTYEEVVSGQQIPTSKPGQVLGAITPSPDINGDGIVNSIDFAILKSNINSNYAPADLNKDGLVNGLDFSILSSWFFATK